MYIFLHTTLVVFSHFTLAEIEIVRVQITYLKLLSLKRQVIVSLFQNRTLPKGTSLVENK